MDACPLLITSIVAVKPEDQGTFFQDFLGLFGYLCSIGGFYTSSKTRRVSRAEGAHCVGLFLLPQGYLIHDMGRK